MKTVLGRLVWIIIILPAIYLALIWKQIPQTVPMHFDIHGNVDGYGSKNYLILLVILTPVVYLILTNIYKIDPKKYAALNKERLQRIAFYVTIFLTAILVMLVYQITHNDVVHMMKFILVATGLLVALRGSNMYNMKPNYFTGLRLPWTLDNEDNWRKTHQLAGRLWFFGGLFFAILVFLLNEQWTFYTGAAILAILILIPVLYSFNLYKKQTKKNHI